MLNIIKDRLKKFDYFLLLILAALCTVSFFAIYSASYESSTETVLPYPFKQLKILAGSAIVYISIAFIGYRRITRFAPAYYIIGLIFLTAVLFKGTVEMGAQRWLAFGPIKGQPSELFKIVWVLTLAWAFQDLEDERLGFKKLFLRSILIIPPFLLVYKQPDLGTALTYLALLGLVAFILGIRVIIIFLLIILIGVSAPITWSKLKPYQKNRLITFITPDKDTSDSGYQALQSRIAVGSGGIFGKGYLKGTQSHLRFMPERHTDFIYSVICEELGLVGGILVILLFVTLLLRILYISSQLKESRGKLICIATASLIFFQFFVNINMTLGTMPIVGVPLPLISYGGSSLLTFITLLGLVNSIYICRNDSPV